MKGPKINGTLIAPAGDWLRVMPAGNFRLDVRATIKTDDGAIIYFAYNGIISASKEVFDRFVKGDVLTSKDLYFVTAPTMQTSAEKYAWVNHVQFIGKLVEVKAGEGAYVTYDYLCRTLSSLIRQLGRANQRKVPLQRGLLVYIEASKIGSRIAGLSRTDSAHTGRLRAETSPEFVSMGLREEAPAGHLAIPVGKHVSTAPVIDRVE